MSGEKKLTNSELIEKLTGVNKSEQIRIMEQVKQNHKLLNSCNLHDFSIDTTPDRTFGKKFKCSNCGGVVDATEKRWYELGLTHSSNRTL